MTVSLFERCQVVFSLTYSQIISAAVQSHIADNDTRSLPKDSLYVVIKDEIHAKRYGMSQRACHLILRVLCADATCRHWLVAGRQICTGAGCRCDQWVKRACAVARPPDMGGAAAELVTEEAIGVLDLAHRRCY